VKRAWRLAAGADGGAIQQTRQPPSRLRPKPRSLGVQSLEPRLALDAAGKTATLRFATQPGCTAPPVVTVENAFGRRPLDTANVVVDEARSLIRVPMTRESGAGRVTVSNCGVSRTILLYNKGTGLPDGFPTDLKRGIYQLSFSVDGGPSINIARVPLTNLRDFAGRIEKIVGRVVSTFPLPGECTRILTWVPESNTRFGYTIGVRCIVEDQPRTSTFSFLMKRT
jgi:hypothetical protein